MTPVPNAAEIEAAARLLRAGRLVAFPTETVYGLGANALDPEAVARIYGVKGRPPTSPLIVHVASIEMAQSLVAKWPDLADCLAQRFWPGPLTLVLEKQPTIPSIVTAGLATVGLRMPAHPMALALIKAAGVPLAAPSANRFTQLSPTTADHARRSLGFAAALYDKLHGADTGGYDWIAVDAPPKTPDWEAVRDRLQRAASINERPSDELIW